MTKTVEAHANVIIKHFDEENPVIVIVMRGRKRKKIPGGSALDGKIEVLTGEIFHVLEAMTEK